MTDNSEPAFPQLIMSGPAHSSSGMTLRDYFAGQALAGVMAGLQNRKPHSVRTMATACYAAADAMLAEREK